jgi:hypothetical protein
VTDTHNRTTEDPNFVYTYDERPHGRTFQPALQLLRNELRTVVATDVLRCAAEGEQVLQHQQHVAGRERPADFRRQAFPGELVDHDQDLPLPTVLGPVDQEVAAPDVMAVRRPMTDAAVLALTR